LYTALQKEGFATENRRPDNAAFGVGDVTADETGGSLNDNRSATGDTSGGSPGEHAHYTVVEIDGQFSNVT
jgi:hypothetical protein